MAIADDALLQEHSAPSGSVVLTTEPHAPPIPIDYAIVSDETVMERENTATSELVFKRFIQFSIDSRCPMYSGIEHPLRKGSFSVNGTEYAVHAVTRDSFGMAILEGRRYGLVSVQRRDYQGGDYS